MHLHLWKPELRKRGEGTQLVKMSLPLFFETFKLQKLYCEPYALNPAPNKTLPKLGFQFVEQYETIPGWINLPQIVRKYVLDRNNF
ncbi:MAG: GNAT family protein [Bacteroidota bacterium]